jgi:hypothetical protein
MLIRTLCLSGVVACVAATAALPSPYGENSSRSTAQILHRHAKLRLPRELKMVWRQEEHAHLKAMPKAERHGWLKRRWAAMSISDREHKIAELQAKWNRLPSSVRQAMLQRKEQHREARRMQKAEMRATGQTSARPVR